MSKYIRTKDGIFEIEKIEKYFLDESQKLFINNTMRIAFKENEVLKQADTIEKLCDCLMFVDNDEEKDFLITGVNEININYSKKETCYGCIKVELPNGAIRIEPVAKFNEKWSFELI